MHRDFFCENIQRINGHFALFFAKRLKQINQDLKRTGRANPPLITHFVW